MAGRCSGVEHQRAMVAATLANLQYGGDRRSEDFKVPIGTLKEPAVTMDQAAKLLNVSKRSIKRARVVRDSGDLARHHRLGAVRRTVRALRPRPPPATGRRGRSWCACGHADSTRMGIAKLLGFAGRSTPGSGGNQCGNSCGSQGGNSGGDSCGPQCGSSGDIELHVVDGRLIACGPGEPPPLSLHQHAKAFLEWLRDHEKVPGNEVPVAVMETVLYPTFTRETGLPMQHWRAVSAILEKLPGVKKYRADWRGSDRIGDAPMVFKVRKGRRGKVVPLAEARRA